jgi:hypothetical protein
MKIDLFKDNITLIGLAPKVDSTRLKKSYLLCGKGCVEEQKVLEASGVMGRGGGRKAFAILTH